MSIAVSIDIAVASFCLR